MILEQNCKGKLLPNVEYVIVRFQYMQYPRVGWVLVGLEDHFTQRFVYMGPLKAMSPTITPNVAAIDTQYCIIIPRFTRGKI